MIRITLDDGHVATYPTWEKAFADMRCDFGPLSRRPEDAAAFADAVADAFGGSVGVEEV
jgi:hypothetical protein